MLKVAVVQMTSGPDVERNLASVAALVGTAQQEGARVVLLPENFAYLGAPHGRRAAAESLSGGGPILAALGRLAKQHDVFIVGGALPERSSDPNRPYQTSVVVSPTGELVAHYRKLHLYDANPAQGESYCESESMTPGDTVVDVTIEGFKLGLTICYDVRFPELYGVLRSRGVDLLLVPASFTLTTGKDHWHVLLRARAIETQSYVAAAAQFGRSGERSTYGKSLIADPWGDVVVQCSDGEGVATAAIHRDQIERVRRSMPMERRA